MSHPTIPAEKQSKPVGTQELPAGKRKVKHRCCEHCHDDVHSPHTKGCPPTTAQKMALTTNELLAADVDEMHEKALNGEPPFSAEELKKAVSEAIQDQFAVTESWQPKRVIKFVIECPSGQKALVRHLDTMDLVRADLIEELDFFTKKLFPSSIDQAGNPVDNKDETTIWDMLRDPENRCRFLQMSNKLMATASVKPKIVNDGVVLVDDENGSKTELFGHQVENLDEEIKHFGQPIPLLKDGECYAGAIDFADRLTFFSELNKPLQSIEPFREEQNAVLASMESVEIPGSTPQ